MANYKVEITNSAQKELNKLDKKLISKIIEKLDLMETNPFISGYKKLVAKSGYRIRIGDYRIIYDVFEKEKLVVVSRVAHRSEVYK